MELSQIPAAFHSKLRLAVIAALLSGPKNFRALQDLTGATPGNLGKQLEVLEAEGYLRSEKAFVGRRPNTTYTLLPPTGGNSLPSMWPCWSPCWPGPRGKRTQIPPLVTRLPWKNVRRRSCAGGRS